MPEIIPLGIIGGTGLYNFPGLIEREEHDLETPYGKPSAPVITGLLEGKKIAFLARHGLGHQIGPSEVNYRANILALKIMGVLNIISVNACGSLREDYAPGDIVVPDQLIDNTRGRPHTFSSNGLVAHIEVADPFCNRLGRKLIRALISTGSRKIHSGGTFVTIEGPRFSTRAESNLFRSLGMSIIGMTTSPEAFLAREAGMCYSVMAHVTDYDVWNANKSPVSVDIVVKTLSENTHFAQTAICNMIPDINENEDCQCRSTLEGSIITQENFIPSETRKKLDILLGKKIT
jgi:5'-methylthioadenosine phosphorylase